LNAASQQLAFGLACKQLLLRVWYTDLTNADGDSLRLLLELSVHLDSLCNEQEPDYSRRSNLLVFEIFGKHFTEPLDAAAGSVPGEAEGTSPTRKPSYSLSLMSRLHDFQRVGTSRRRAFVVSRVLSVSLLT
jgi:hypothetical protein